MVNLANMHKSFKILSVDLDDLIVKRQCILKFLLFHLQIAEHEICFFVIFVDIKTFLKPLSAPCILLLGFVGLGQVQKCFSIFWVLFYGFLQALNRLLKFSKHHVTLPQSEIRKLLL